MANLSDQAAQIERAIRPEAIALGLFALVVALAALVIIAQAVLRQLRASRIDLTTLRALGLTRMQLWSISLLQVTAVAIVGGLVAVAASVLASPIMPLGAARLAEPSPGIDVDVAVLGLGFVAVVVLLVAAVAWPSWRLNSETQTTRYSRTAPLRSGRRLAWLTSSAAPVTASLGIREALNPGAARGAVPVRSALVGTILSIVVVIGTLTFGANLVHLVTTPQLYGQTWQASIDTQFQTIPSSFIHASLNHRRGVVGWIAGNFGTVDVMNSTHSRHRSCPGSRPAGGADPGEWASAHATRRDRAGRFGAPLGRPRGRAGFDGPRQWRAAEDAHRRSGGVSRL